MNTTRTIFAILLGSTLLAACATAPPREADRTQLINEADSTINAFIDRDPTLTDFFETAHAYAVFPSIGKGGVGLGGAYGRGVAYEQGVPVGYCDMTQGTIGLQLGGQEYSQVIFFETPHEFERFKAGRWTMAAGVSAVAASEGAAATADYERGVAVFSMTRTGLMFEAAVGGQQFTFQPINAGRAQERGFGTR